ncbi:hypothetical protein KSAC_02190 [Komagataeibacter saccharivorans]|nr:hypothetical protein KSAC_02190 [Komagataeibacter saccharivorans]
MGTGRKMMVRSSHQSLPASVAQRLREDILDGDLVSGQPLVEAQMVERFGVSRNTVREAMHSLAQSGLVTVISHKGSFVRQLTASDIREIYEIRRIVETGCCIRVETGRWTQLAPVFTAAFTQARSAMRDGEWRMAGTASLLFHRLLVGACGSDQLTAFFDNICAQMRLAFQMVQPQDAIQRPWLEKDVAIFETLREGKTGQAITLIEDYLKYSEDLLFTLIPGIDE